MSLIVCLSASMLARTQLITPNVGQLKGAPDCEYYFHSPEGVYYFSPDKFSFVQTKFDSLDSKKIAINYRTDFVFHNSVNSDIKEIGTKELKRRFLLTHGTFNINEEFKSIAYTNIWNNIDLVFDVVQGRLKWEFVVHPGGNPNDIRIEVVGADRLSASNSDLIIENPLSNFTHTYPSVYEISNGAANNVLWSFEINDNEIGFDIKNYNSNKQLIIDPWCTYYGGTDVDEVYGFDTDDMGNSYITGYTYSNNLPTTAGTMDTSYNLDYDGFVAKMDPNSGHIWSTYIGGTAGDYFYGVDVDVNGNVYVVGNGTSNDMPVSGSGVYQSSFGGSYDSYVYKLNASGAFVWGTYYGGNGGDLALTSDLLDDKVLVAGYTTGMIAMGSGSFQSVHGGALDAFVAIIDTSGNLDWHTYYGGIDSEDAHDACFDENGNVLLVGDSYSNNFPVSSNAYQPLSNGGRESYIVKFNSTGQREFATFFGGTGDDDILAITANHNKIYVGGYTTSNDLLMMGASLQTSIATGKDGFYAAFSDTGNLVYCTYFGGDHNDEIIDMHTTDNRIVLAFESRSSDLTLYGGPFSSINGGLFDNFILLLDTSMSPGYSSYMGNMGSEYVCGVRLLDDHTIYFAGHSEGDTISFGTSVFQDVNLGYSDGFICKLDNIVGYFTGIEGEQLEANTIIRSNIVTDRIYMNDAYRNKYFTILGVDGRIIVRDVKIGQSYDLSDLANGTYIILNESCSLSQKFIKQ